MTPDEIKKLLERDEPTEEFEEWADSNRKTSYTSLPELIFEWECYQKGLRDGQRVKVKPIVLSEYTGIADCPNCYNRLGSEDSFCWNCGAEVERSG